MTLTKNFLILSNSCPTNFIFASREEGDGEGEGEGEGEGWVWRRAFDFKQASSTLTCEIASGKADLFHFRADSWNGYV